MAPVFDLQAAHCGIARGMECLYAEATRSDWIDIRVDLGDGQIVPLCSDLVQDRAIILQGPLPRCPEIYQHPFVSLCYRIKICICSLYQITSHIVTIPWA